MATFSISSGPETAPCEWCGSPRRRIVRVDEKNVYSDVFACGFICARNVVAGIVYVKPPPPAPAAVVVRRAGEAKET